MMALLLLLGVALVVGAGELLSPEEIFSRVYDRYGQVQTYSAKIVFEMRGLLSEATVMRLWTSWPQSRAEYEWDRPLDSPVRLIWIADFAAGKYWIYYSTDRWEEVEDPALSLREPISSLLPWPVTWEKAVQEERRGRPAWRLEGLPSGTPAVGPEPFAFPAGVPLILWVDPETFELLEAEVQAGPVVFSIFFEEFQAHETIPDELFTPPPPEQIHRVFRVSLEGRSILWEAVKRLQALRSFFVRQEVLDPKTRRVSHEIWMYWKPPKLRVEHRTPPSPRLGSELFYGEIVDFHTRTFYVYDPKRERWVRETEGMWQVQGIWDPTIFVAVWVFSLTPNQPIVCLSEEMLGRRAVWRLAGMPTPGTDEPPPEWWVDKETYLVVQYVKHVKVKEFDEKTGEVRLRLDTLIVRLRSFEPDVEIPEELFAVPE